MTTSQSPRKGLYRTGEADSQSLLTFSRPERARRSTRFSTAHGLSLRTACPRARPVPAQVPLMVELRRCTVFVIFPCRGTIAR